MKIVDKFITAGGSYAAEYPPSERFLKESSLVRRLNDQWAADFSQQVFNKEYNSIAW